MTTGAEREQLLELLQICEDYFRHADRATHADLDTVLRKHDITGGPRWLIDMLSLTALRLQREHAASINL
jgi:hypothetical protein